MSVDRSRVRIVAGILLGGAVFAGVLFAAEEAPWKAPSRAARKANPIAADEKSIAAGRALYGKHCLDCHDAEGKGHGKASVTLEKSPGDLSKPTMWDQSDGTLFWKITEGKKPMPSYETLATDTERWQIVNYVRTLAPKPAATASQPTNDGGKK